MMSVLYKSHKISLAQEYTFHVIKYFVVWKDGRGDEELRLAECKTRMAVVPIQKVSTLKNWLLSFMIVFHHGHQTVT